MSPDTGGSREHARVGPNRRGADCNKMLIAGDIGGTKTLLAAAEGGPGEIRVVAKRRYPSGGFNGLIPMLREFLSTHATLVAGAELRACFAVAGPVRGERAWVTNLGWRLSAAAIASDLGMVRVRLINDFQAVGYGIQVLSASDLEAVRVGTPQRRAPCAVLGAGTGLGQAILVWHDDHYEALPTEGGHADFAPGDPLQSELLAYLRERYGHVSWERVCSGGGLVNIAEFLRDSGRATMSSELTRALMQGNGAATVSTFALSGRDALAEQALGVFVRVYGAQAGNLALTCLADGGLYVAGGIAPRILQHLKAGPFMEAFMDKGRMARRLTNMPVLVVRNPEVGLLGAALVASRL